VQVTVHTLSALEERVLRALADSRQRWLKAPEIAEDLEEGLVPVVSALNALRRGPGYVTTMHRALETRYALTGLGENALERLDQAAGR
jgi:hypothetical protein